MNNIPTIGGARGIFEIFVPGIFLLINLVVVVYLFPYIDNTTWKDIVTWISNPILSLVIVITFGYLIGVILRMLRTESADNWSARFLRLYDSNARKGKNRLNLYAYEKFPYVGWLGVVCERHLPTTAIDFYNRVWAERNSRSFFNFCKIIIISEDQRAANEIYSTEALSRYISGMYYALLIASFLIASVGTLRFLASGRMTVGLLIMLSLYLFAILGILKNFRFIRIKEVEIMFAASFKNRHLFKNAVDEELPFESTTSSNKFESSKNWSKNTKD